MEAQKEKIFAIGDIHGCLAKLFALMEKLPIDRENDTLVFLGDYIDRGPDSRGVVEAVLQVRQTHRKTVCLRGNHEQMLLDFLMGGRNEDLFMANGGDSTLRNYGLNLSARGATACIPDHHMDFFYSLASLYETEAFIFVHAGLRPGVPLREQHPEDLIWIRREFTKSPHDFGRRVIFGHTPFGEPLVEANKIGLDTGAVYGGRLTCLELTEMTFYQV
jgi:serine/threonine protein phosphatase 1